MSLRTDLTPYGSLRIRSNVTGWNLDCSSRWNSLTASTASTAPFEKCGERNAVRNRERTGGGVGGLQQLSPTTFGQILKAFLLWFSLRTYPLQVTKGSQKRDICEISNALPAIYGLITFVVISNFSSSLTSNITSHSMKNLACNSLLRWKMIVLPYSHFISYVLCWAP